MSEFAVAPLAGVDIDEAWDYIAKHNARAGKVWVETLYEKFLFLAEQPLAGEACPQIREDLRRFVAGKYVIYYRVRESGIEIARVLHGARDVDTAFGASL